MALAKGEVQNLLVMGKSGAGKQPRIDVLVEEFGLEQLSTGNIFREYLGRFDGIGFTGDLASFYDGTREDFIPDEEIAAALGDRAPAAHRADLVLGAKAKYFIEAGRFVPDRITNALFAGYFTRAGCRGMVLDGYPRTVDQAAFLLDLVEKEGTRIDAIILVDNEDEAIVARTTGRRICPECKKVFHLEFKPPREGRFCTACGAEVILRSDDTEEKIRHRLREFHEKAAPALAYLEEKGIPRTDVPGNLPLFTDAAVRESVLAALARL